MMDDVSPEQPSQPFEVSDLDYELPDELIAQHPAPRRDQSRMLVIQRESGRLLNLSIGDIVDRLRREDLLVLNDTKVLAAKFAAKRKTGGAVSGLFIGEKPEGDWLVLLSGSRRLRPGEVINIHGANGEVVPLELIESIGEGQWRARTEVVGSAHGILERIGEAPLPPYIRRPRHGDIHRAEDMERYQTVYARVPGAVAAPTAGLHLTGELLDRIRSRGVETAFVTLHVGIGTFKPITAVRLADHVMHSERFELPLQTAEAVGRCRRRGGRVVAVGTTSVRVLESLASDSADRTVAPKSGSTGIFIYPPYRFRVVDALLTNFHLPRSTLLALIMAFAGIETTRSAYRHAIDARYRFYSYGDAMLIE